MARGVNPQDGYLEALVKNMPSETLAGYLAVMGMLSAAKSTPVGVLWLVWAVFLVCTPLYLWLARPKTETTPRPWFQVWIFSPIAFFLWSMTTTGPWATVETAGLIGGVGVILASALIFPLLSMAIARGSS
jgi:hypothetical protein